MTRTLQTLLDERAAGLVGRDGEREALLRLLDGEAPVVAYVHGLAGVGKSALLRAFAQDARSRQARVVALDCSAVEPTERGLLSALSIALSRELESVDDLVGEIAQASPRTVLVLDTFERFWLLDTWMRQVLVPALPADVRLVLAGREAPAAWRRQFGELLLALRLESLAPPAAREVLLGAGLTPEDAARVDRIAQGHPLALQLAAGALSGPTSIAAADALLDPVVEELAELYLVGLEPRTRRALEAGSAVRRTTLSLLEAMLPEVPAQEAFERLRGLPFVELTRDGLVIHDTVREVTTALLGAADPAARRDLRTRAWSCLRRELRTAGDEHLWRYTADMLYLVENPIVHHAFFPRGGDRFAVEPARPQDAAAIAAIADRHLAPDGAELIRAWWALLPEAFRVARDVDGAVAAFCAVCEPGDVPRRLYDRDALLASWREHLRDDPMPRGSRVLFSRLLVTGDRGEEPSDAGSPLWLDLKRSYLEMRPDLRRVYTYVRDDRPEVLDALAPLGFVPLALAPATIGDATYRTILNDFGPGSIDGWLADVVGRELREEGAEVVDTTGRELVLDGRRVELTRLEADVLAYLGARRDQAVAREALLRDVWGYEWSGGSNVVEVTVSGLRKKLGDRAPALETVRGVGYRLRALG